MRHWCNSSSNLRRRVTMTLKPRNATVMTWTYCPKIAWVWKDVKPWNNAFLNRWWLKTTIMMAFRVLANIYYQHITWSSPQWPYITLSDTVLVLNDGKLTRLTKNRSASDGTPRWWVRETWNLLKSVRWWVSNGSNKFKASKSAIMLDQPLYNNVRNIIESIPGQTLSDMDNHSLCWTSWYQACKNHLTKAPVSQIKCWPSQPLALPQAYWQLFFRPQRWWNTNERWGARKDYKP